MAPNPLAVTRFAPSPTGHLHIGGARSALFCWAFARRARREGLDGRFLIRIEDTDQARSSEESARGILEDLAWLGIEWDDGPELKVQDRAEPHGSPGSARTIGGDPRGVGPFFQARRVDLYNAYIDHLAGSGRAYPAFESPEELDARRRDAITAKKTYRYERPADVEPGVFHAERWARARSGERHVVRFVAPNEEVVVHDSILGDVRTAAAELDDLVIRKADGFPTYHFAVVIDDELMGITHVLRAQEHLANTPRHVAMQHALRRIEDGRPFNVPVYGHMPVICNMDGSKMSKRDKAKTARKAAKDAMSRDPSITGASLGEQTGLGEAAVAGFLAGENDSLQAAESLAARFGIPLPEVEIWDFRRSGYLPEVIVNFVALLGWNPGMKDGQGKDLEKFDLAFIEEHFSIDRVGKSSSKFDRAKLLSFNADAIAAMSDEAFVGRVRAWLAEYEPDALARLDARGPGTLAVLAPALRPRCRTLRDAIRQVAFALVSDDGYGFDPASIEKHLRAADGAGAAALREARRDLATLGTWTPSAIQGTIEQVSRRLGFVTEKGVNVGPVAQPIRVAIAGVAVTPPLGESLAVLGASASLARIDRCLRELGAASPA